MPESQQRPTSYPGWHGTLPRQRATLIVRRGRRLLLVRDRGRNTYMLPGGGIEKGETPIAAAVRELREETGLETRSIRYMFTYEGKYNDHHLFEAETDGEVIVGQEIESFTWWDKDKEDSTPVYRHVRGIAERLEANSNPKKTPNADGRSQ